MFYFPVGFNQTAGLPGILFIGERGEKTEEFKQMVERRTGLPVVLWDERLTTVAADRAMIEAGIRRENRKKYVDRIAATFILQGYLDVCKNREHRKE